MESPRGATRIIRFGSFQANPIAGELRRNGTKVRMQDQPFQILALLLERAGDVVTREELQQRLWAADTFVDFDNGLNIAVKKLRVALGDDAGTPRYIETVPRRGYRFLAQVTVDTAEPARPSAPRRAPLVLVPKQEEPADAAALAETVPEVQLDSRRAAVTVHSSQRARTSWAASAVIAAAILVIAIVLGVRDRLRGRNAGETITSIAVLPLRNLSGDPSQEYFADGMTEELITDLAQISSLRVISRTSAMQYKDTSKNLPEIARELNVEAVVEGAIVRSGNRVRVTAQLIEAKKDKHLWAASYERDLPDVLVIENDVARNIADQIRIKLTPDEQAHLEKSRPVNPEAYEAYLKGQYFTHKLQPDAVREGFKYFEKAIQVDPSYAAPYAGLAYNYLSQVEWTMSPSESMPRAKAAAEKALELDPSLAEAHNYLAVVQFWYDWDWTAAEMEFRRAIALNPGQADVRSWYGNCLVWVGRSDEAIAEGRRALSLDPASPEMSRALAQSYYFARRYPEALTQLRESLQMEPDYWFARMFLGMTYLRSGNTSEAVEELEAAVRLGPAIPDAVSALGSAYALSGQPGKAKAVLNELKRQRQSRGSYVSPYAFAVVYAGLGEKDQAFKALDSAYEERSIFMTWLQTDPALDNLRSDPRFPELVRKVGLIR